jgi:heat shock protein HslJ
MTMMSGPEPLMQQERAFIRALKGVRGYHLTGTTLRLLDGETVIATFKARVEQGG